MSGIREAVELAGEVERLKAINSKLIKALQIAHNIMTACVTDEVLDSDGQEYVENWHMEAVEQALTEVKGE